MNHHTKALTEAQDTQPTLARQSSRLTLCATAIVLMAAQLAVSTSFAQSAPPAPPDAAAGVQPAADPPGRVARLNYMAGTVTTEPAGATDWSYAQLNRPLTTGDQLWNDQNARSEMHIGSTAVRLGPSTSLDVLNLDDSNAQLKVAQGTLSTRIREMPQGGAYEIDTPNLALGLNGPGDYRVDVAPDGSSTTVTVRSGSATVYGENGQVPVAAGQQMRFAGTALQQVADNAAPAPDPLDQWAAQRDAAEDASVTARYVSRDVPGYQDLDANGTWRQTPQYGAVWSPNAVPAGWSPYHDGHWIWQAPWGWTWVDDAPWGFAPYHYGRWAYVDDSWAWVPGPVVVSQPPMYAPALVAFVGGGGGGVDWGVSLAVGGIAAAGVAWFPLGPGEPWHPRWGDRWSPGYYDRVNRTTIVNNINIHNNTYVNYHVRGGVTAVPATAFVHGQPTGRFAQQVDPRQWHNARINPGGPGIAPVRQSFAPGMRNAAYRPPASVTGREVFATRHPAMPAAYHDTLAQRFAQGGGRVPGAGQPIVRTSVPAHMASIANARGGYGVPGQNVRVVQSHLAGGMPGAARGAPGMAGGPAAPGGPTAQAMRAEGPHGAAGQPMQGAPGPMAHAGGPGAPGGVGNGVPRPPQMAGAMPMHGGQPMGAQPGNPQMQAGRHEPAWTQPHTPMAQQRGMAPMQAQQAQPMQHGSARPEFAQQAHGPMNQAIQNGVQRGGPGAPNAPSANPPQQAHEMQREAPRPQQAAATQAPREAFHPQQMQRPQPSQPPMRQPEAPRMAQMQARPQPQPQPRPEFHPQPQPQPRQEPRPQPQQAQQPHAQPQPQQQPHEQHQAGGGGGGGHGGGNDHHRG